MPNNKTIGLVLLLIIVALTLAAMIIAAEYTSSIEPKIVQTQNVTISDANNIAVKLVTIKNNEQSYSYGLQDSKTSFLILMTPDAEYIQRHNYSITANEYNIIIARNSVIYAGGN